MRVNIIVRIYCSVFNFDNNYRIQRVYRVKAVAKDWFGNGEKTGITGRFEFIQETPFSPVKTLVMLKGLGGIVNNYHVHEVRIHCLVSTGCN